MLLEAVAATVSGPRLSLTEIGRRFGGASELRHRIKRADRLLGNRRVQHRFLWQVKAPLPATAAPIIRC